jgi:hypothetical protein
MDEFLIFYAPFLLVIASIGVAFWIAKDDRAVREPHE